MWQRADKLSVEIHRVTLGFPKFENFELGGQMRRSSGSVPDNISEGSTKGKKEFVHYLKTARGSAKELEGQISRAFRFGYFSEEDRDRYLKEVLIILKMISGVIRFLGKGD